MPREFTRADRVADQIQRELAQLITEELDENSEEVQTSLEVLQRASGFLRGHLGKSMRLRVVPQLRFRFDRLAGQSRHMESLIRKAVASDERRNDGDDPEDGGGV